MCVLGLGPMLVGLLEHHMKSAKDPEEFHATRATRQPNGKVPDPSDVAKGRTTPLVGRIPSPKFRAGRSLGLVIRIRNCFDSFTTAAGR
jgi:hypothetical protein